MNRPFIIRRIFTLIGLEILLYWGLDYKINYIFWITSFCFLAVTIIYTLIHELESKDANGREKE